MSFQSKLGWKASWNPKQPVLDGCLLISNHFPSKGLVHHPIETTIENLESSNWNNHRKYRNMGCYHRKYCLFRAPACGIAMPMTQGVGVMLCSWCRFTRKLSRQISLFFSTFFFFFRKPVFFFKPTTFGWRKIHDPNLLGILSRRPKRILGNEWQTCLHLKVFQGDQKKDLRTTSFGKVILSETSWTFFTSHMGSRLFLLCEELLVVHTNRGMESAQKHRKVVKNSYIYIWAPRVFRAPQICMICKIGLSSWYYYCNCQFAFVYYNMLHERLDCLLSLKQFMGLDQHPTDLSLCTKFLKGY